MQPGADGTASARKGKLGWVIAPAADLRRAGGAVRLRAADRRSLEAAVGAARQAGAGDAVPGGRRADGGRPAGAGLLQRRARAAGSRASSTSGRRGACPCAEEQPLLVELQKRTGVALYGVNYKDDAASARRFLGRYGNPFKAVGTDGAGPRRHRVGRLRHAGDVRAQRPRRDRVQARRRRSRPKACRPSSCPPSPAPKPLPTPAVAGVAPHVPIRRLCVALSLIRRAQ